MKRVLTIAAIALSALVLGYLFIARGTSSPTDSENSDTRAQIAPTSPAFPGETGKQPEIRQELTNFMNARRIQRQQELQKRKDLVEKFRDQYRARATGMLEERHSAEDTDEIWTTEMSTALTEILNKPEFAGTKMMTADCRTSLCRVVVVHESLTSGEFFTSNGSTQGPWGGMVRGIKNTLPDGRLTTEIFTTRGKDKTPFLEIEDEILEEVLNENDPP